MGITLSSIFNRLFFRKKPMRILILGLNGVGKTTVLYKLKLKTEVVTTIPTIGYNVETVEYKNVSFNMWDIGGGAKMPGLWRHYFLDTVGVIFVIDSNNREQISEVEYELHRVLTDDDLRDSVFLIFANKQDIPNSMSTAELTDKLKLNTVRYRRWYIQAVCATQGNGLYKGLDWLSNELAR